MLILFASTINVACQNRNNRIFSHIIQNYRETLLTESVDYSLTVKETLSLVEVNKYKMTSQSWSPNNMVSPDKWQHDVDMYIHDVPKSRRAIIVVNNGINYSSINLRTLVKKH